VSTEKFLGREGDLLTATVWKTVA